MEGDSLEGIGSSLSIDDNASVSSRNMGDSKTNVPAFLKKTFEMLEDPFCSEYVTWRCSNTGQWSFSVLKPTEFAAEILPRFFKHNRLSSFVRQLNIYGFHKCGPGSWEFSHPSFMKDRRDLLINIKRKDVSDHSRKQVLEEERRRNLVLRAEVQKLSEYMHENEKLQIELQATRRKQAEMEQLLGNLVRGVASASLSDTGFGTARKRRRADRSLKAVASKESDDRSASVSSLLNPETDVDGNAPSMEAQTSTTDLDSNQRQSAKADLDAGMNPPTVSRSMAFSRSTDASNPRFDSRSSEGSAKSKSISSLLSKSSHSLLSSSSHRSSAISIASKHQSGTSSPDVPIRFPPEIKRYLQGIAASGEGGADEESIPVIETETLDAILDSSLGPMPDPNQKKTVRKALYGLLMSGVLAGESSTPHTPEQLPPNAETMAEQPNSHISIGSNKPPYPTFGRVDGQPMMIPMQNMDGSSAPTMMLSVPQMGYYDPSQYTSDGSFALRMDADSDAMMSDGIRLSNMQRSASSGQGEFIPAAMKSSQSSYPYVKTGIGGEREEMELFGEISGRGGVSSGIASNQQNASSKEKVANVPTYMPNMMPEQMTPGQAVPKVMYVQQNPSIQPNMFFPFAAPPTGEVDPNWSKVQAQIQAQLQLANQMSAQQSQQKKLGSDKQQAANALLNLSDSKAQTEPVNTTAAQNVLGDSAGNIPATVTFDREVHMNRPYWTGTSLPTVDEVERNISNVHIMPMTDTTGSQQFAYMGSMPSVDEYSMNSSKGDVRNRVSAARLIDISNPATSSSRGSYGQLTADVEGSEFFQPPIWAGNSNKSVGSFEPSAPDPPTSDRKPPPQKVRHSKSEIGGDVGRLGTLAAAALSLSGSASQSEISSQSNASLGPVDSLGSIRRSHV